MRCPVMSKLCKLYKHPIETGSQPRSGGILPSPRLQSAGNDLKAHQCRRHGRSVVPTALYLSCTVNPRLKSGAGGMPPLRGWEPRFFPEWLKTELRNYDMAIGRHYTLGKTQSAY